MNCTEFKTAVEWTLDTHGTLTAMAREHLSTCHSCRAHWDIQQQLDEAISVWQNGSGIDALTDLSAEHVTALVETLRGTAPAISLSEAVLKELMVPDPAERDWRPHSARVTLAQVVPAKDSQTRAPRHTHAARGSRAGGIALVAAASCLLFAIMIVRQTPSTDVRHSLAVAAPTLTSPAATVTPLRSRPEAGLEVAAPDVSETLTAVFSDFQSGYREMATETTLAARDLVNSIPVKSVPLKPLPLRSNPVEETNSASLNSGEVDIILPSVDPTRIWRPISTKVETALGFLWTTVPSEVPAG